MKKQLNSKMIRGFLLPAAVVFLFGCVERRLTIITEPPEAIVWLNDEEIGTTPVTVGFNWYGDYKVRIEKEGCEIVNTHREMKRPLEDYFPADFFAEVLWPGTIRRDIAWSFDLKPVGNPSAEQLLEQSAAFREKAQQEFQTSR